MHYLSADRNEGVSVHWCFDGVPCMFLRQCSLCQSSRCTTPELDKFYRDGMWYLNLGGETRYADVAGRTQKNRKRGVATYRNPMFFCGTTAVMHLGAKMGASTDHGDHFLLFDRRHIHRVLEEVRRGNSVSAESYRRKPQLHMCNKEST